MRLQCPQIGDGRLGVFIMARYTRFTFLVNSDERRMIVALAERLQRPQSDAIRFVIREAVRALDADPAPFVSQPRPVEVGRAEAR